MSLRTLFSFMLLGATLGTAQAAAILYTSEAAYLAAVGATKTYITFDGSLGVAVSGASFSPDVIFQSDPGDGTSVFHVNNAITDLGGNGSVPNGVGRLFAVFAQPEYAFGFHYLSGEISQIAIVFDLAGCCQELDTTSATGFIGVVSDTSMAVVDFINAQLPNNAGADRYFIDDFRINAPIINTPLPEPSAYALVLVGLAGLRFFSRRSR